MWQSELISHSLSTLYPRQRDPEIPLDEANITRWSREWRKSKHAESGEWANSQSLFEFWVASRRVALSAASKDLELTPELSTSFRNARW